jgi:hypothetical protein
MATVTHRLLKKLIIKQIRINRPLSLLNAENDEIDQASLEYNTLMSLSVVDFLNEGLVSPLGGETDTITDQNLNGLIGSSLCKAVKTLLSIMHNFVESPLLRSVMNILFCHPLVVEAVSSSPFSMIDFESNSDGKKKEFAFSLLGILELSLRIFLADFLIFDGMSRLDSEERIWLEELPDAVIWKMSFDADVVKWKGWLEISAAEV